ncbi:iron-siderophore ABC transporter substrate-binding protein [Corynebacterium hindlerae]|uniref:iron-siderophore ABC transporter substrate-binding protein n=1 Tax=Corynebacterium hindlerae TaxID=699041 RepID=UPI001AD77E8D|nr:iron-siderophore ABC transporter substrate-binding protein [Corynebacterium hindlerae]QTH59287.1 iron-siderophore ABC transporter substrate-binding protein [Corynebacterium hindlerae]
MNKTCRALALAFTAASITLTLTACGDADTANQSTSNSASTADAQSAFPVTIKHAFGETTITKAPQRIASIGWANHEVPLALGQTPVGISKATFGDDDNNGVLPWVEEKLTELGANSGDKAPAIFDETDGVPFEQIANTKPDLILATYSGITQEDYDTLSKIAPVVAYPEMAWGTSLEEMIEISSQALGKAEEGKKLTEELNTNIAMALDKYPNLKGKKVLFTSFGGSSDPSKIGFYSIKDPRMGFLTSHGLSAPNIVTEQSATAEKFWIEAATEKPEQFADVDLIISYSSGDASEDEKKVKEMQADPLLSKIPAIKDGHIAFLEQGPLGAAANPSPLAIPWAIDRYFAVLNDGLQ